MKKSAVCSCVCVSIIIFKIELNRVGIISYVVLKNGLCRHAGAVMSNRAKRVEIRAAGIKAKR